MTTSMTELVSDPRFHGLSGLSLTQLEGTLVAASLVLDAWRTTTRFDFKRTPLERAFRGESHVPIAADFVKAVTGQNFDSLVLAQLDPVAVEFMSYGCEHCRLLEPVLQQVAERLGSREAVLRVNTAIDEELANRYEIEGTPTLVMFSRGVDVGRAVGPNPSVKVLLNDATRPFEGLV